MGLQSLAKGLGGTNLLDSRGLRRRSQAPSPYDAYDLIVWLPGESDIMIFWSGHGYLALVFMAAALLGTDFAVDFVMGEDYPDNVGMETTIAGIIAGIGTWVVGKRLNSGEPRHLVDPETGQEVLAPPPYHSLFFIKLQWWGPILAIWPALLFLLGVE